MASGAPRGFVRRFDTTNVAEWGGIDTDAGLQQIPGGEIAKLPRYGDGPVTFS